jgi:peptidoglycan/LPS O-acetylase OafA/YrhL
VREPSNGTSTEEPGRYSRHIPSLDGIRGLAILAVLAGHLLISNNQSSSRIIEALLSVRDLMWVGVTLFFSLSGFLITGILFDTLGTERYFSSFFARRCLRIFPLYYGVLLVLLLLTRPLHMDWHGQAYRLLTYTPNIPFLKEWDSNPSPYINLKHFWSLAVEEQFYVMWPFIVFWLGTRRKIFLAAIMGSLLALGLRTWLALAGFYPQNHALFFIMDGLLLGGALSLLVRSRYREHALKWGGLVCVLAIVTTLAESFTHSDFDWQKSFYLTTIGMTIIALGMTGLIAATLKAGSMAETFFRARVLRFFGRYSYGLYVYHYSVDRSLTTRLRTTLEAHGFTHTLSILGAAAVVLAISICLALASYHLYEKHFLRLKRLFAYDRKRPKSTPA